MGPIGIVLSAQHKHSTGVLVRCMYSGLVGGFPFVARVVLLACAGGLTFIVCVCLWRFPALVPACLYIPNHRVSLKHVCTNCACVFMRQHRQQAGQAPDVQPPHTQGAILAGRGSPRRSGVERDAGDAAGVALELHGTRAACEGLIACPAQLPELHSTEHPFALNMQLSSAPTECSTSI